jgi:two-component system, LuxR family, sensor kinase FixL
MTELVSNDRGCHAHGDDAPACADIAADSDCESLTAPSALEALLGIVPDRVFLIRADGEIIDCHFQSGERRLVGKNFRELLSGSAGKQAAYSLERALRSGQRQQFTFTRESRGDFREYQAYVTPSGLDRAVAIVRDITFEKLREREIVEITSREQSRLGQDLHDGLGQQLTGISFLSRALEQKLAGRGLPEAAAAAEICHLVVQTLSQTRNLARGLFPVELEASGLVTALKQLGEEVERLFGISCVIESPDELVIEDRDTAKHLFRLAQEAISNSVKHGKAKRVSVALEWLNGSGVLSIRDDGIGFRENATPERGLGLRIMNYRAQKIGGALDMRSVPSGGVHIRCIFPMPLPNHQTTKWTAA